MSLLYQQLSPMFIVPNREEKASRWAWVSRVTSYIPKRKRDELRNCQVYRPNVFYNTFLFALYAEVSWWLQANASEFMRSRRFVLPEIDQVSLRSSLAWKLYWIEVKARVVGPLVDHQATLLVGDCLTAILGTFLANESTLKLTQYAPRRALAISQRESDSVMVGMEVFVVSLWANFVFYAASYLVRRGRAFIKYAQHRFSRQRQGEPSSTYDGARVLDSLVQASYVDLILTWRRYGYSSIGAGVVSMVWPGWGTLLGTLAGDKWAQDQAVSDVHVGFLREVTDSLYRIAQKVRRMDLWKRLLSGGGSSDHPGVSKQRRPSFGSLDNSKDDDSFGEDYLCGCCQTTHFSSDPNSRDRAPISSRSCSHTICRSCVTRCHLAHMERVSNYEEWIKCPLCNAAKAFSSHDHLINRSLCSVIASIERMQSTSPTKKVQ